MIGHVIDPTYFYDAIEEFAFNYNIYYKNEGDTIDDYGRAVSSYKKDTIRGSFQTQGIDQTRNVGGNTQSEKADFYCKSLYRIHINDIIERNNNFYIVNHIHNYDEWGVREAEVEMISLQEYRDFKDWLEYQTGGKIV